MVHVEHGIRSSQSKEATTASERTPAKVTPIRSALDLLTQPGMREFVGKDHVTGVRVSPTELTVRDKAPIQGRIDPKSAPKRP